MQSEAKDYDSWNEVKKKLQLGNDFPDRFPKEGEVWISSVGKNLGFEQNGIGNAFSRPVLVVKKFNNKMFWCIPLSTKQKPFDFYFNFADPDGLNVSGILAQLRLFSIKRLQRKLYTLDSDIFREIKTRLKDLLS